MRLIQTFALITCLASTGGAAPHPDRQNLRNQIAGILHVPEQMPKLQAKEYGQFSPASGVACERVSYATDYSLRVPAIVYHQSAATIAQHPALVVVNGHRGDKSSWYSYWTGILYARAGAIVLTYDPIGEYERNRERSSQTAQHDELLQPDDMARRLSGLMITDVMQGVSYLESRRDVDKKRIAVLGYSMGSFVSALACAIDPRIHACVLTGGGDLDGLGGYWDTSNPMCQGIPYRSLSQLGDRGAAIYALNAKRGLTFVINGSEDDVVDIPHHGPEWFEILRKHTIAESGSAKAVFEYAFETRGGHRPYFVTRPVALWLEEKLKFPDWTRKQIEALPETNIGAWSLQNQLVSAIGPGFAHNEGGTVAVGEAIPAVSREMLHAIPEAVWDSQQRDYIYESWVERAQAAIRSGAQ